MKRSLGISDFLEEISSLYILLFSSISLHWSLRKAFLSLLAILWNSAFRCYIFPFLLCFLLLFFSQLFVRPPQTAILLFCIFFHGDGLDPCLLYNVMNLHPEFIRHSIRFAPAAAAKSLQSCPTLCSPIDCSPPGSAVPGILQARTLEWVAISFSNVWKWKVKVKLLSLVRLFITPPVYNTITTTKALNIPITSRFFWAWGGFLV